MVGCRAVAIQSSTVLVNSSVGHAGVRGGHQRSRGLFALRRERLEIAAKNRGERFRGLPFRMLRCDRPDPIEGELQLKVHRLLRPQGAVIVERRDALGGGHKRWPAWSRHLRDEFDDRSFGGSLVPGRKRVSASDRRRQRGRSQTGQKSASRHDSPSSDLRSCWRTAQPGHFTTSTWRSSRRPCTTSKHFDAQAQLIPLDRAHQVSETRCATVRMSAFRPCTTQNRRSVRRAPG